MKKSPTIICLIGPTAIGKTDLALKIASMFPIDIINVDSAQIYRGMDIGTAKPSKEILNKHPHFLIDICNPEDTYSVGDFLFDASHQIKKSLNKNRIPLLVGGTMLYFHALINGIADLPKSDKKIRTDIEKEAEEIGWKKMHLKLKNIDPTAAEKINCNDKQRIQRALEVFELTGKPLSEFFKDQKNTKNYNFFNICLLPTNRDRLYQRINSRFTKMLSDGLVDEVKNLLASSNISPSNNSMKSIGYREICAFIENKTTLEVAEQQATMATRRLAKRQITWLRSLKRENSYDIFEKNLVKKIHEQISQEFKL